MYYLSWLFKRLWKCQDTIFCIARLLWNDQYRKKVLQLKIYTILLASYRCQTIFSACLKSSYQSEVTFLEKLTGLFRDLAWLNYNQMKGLLLYNNLIPFLLHTVNSPVSQCTDLPKQGNSSFLKGGRRVQEHFQTSQKCMKAYGLLQTVQTL